MSGSGTQSLLADITSSNFSLNPFNGLFTATTYSGSGASLTTNSVPPTSVNFIRFYAGTIPAQTIPTNSTATVIWNNQIENTGSAYTHSAGGTITVNTSGTYAITVSGTWNGNNYNTPFGVTIMGGIRIVLNTGFEYMGVTAFNASNYISTVSTILRLTNQTFTIQAYNVSAGSLTFDGLIEILRIGG